MDTKSGLTHNEIVARLIRGCRERLDPHAVPGLMRGCHTRESKRVSQEEAADLIGVTPRWYGSLERGEVANYSPSLLARTAYALRMTEAERRMLYLVLGYDPPRIERSDNEVSESLYRTLQEVSWPAYISDGAWNFLAYNGPFVDWSPWISYVSNVMLFVFTYPQARVQLADWETDWAPAMLAQLRFAHVHFPDDDRVTDLLEKILAANEFARSIWDNLETHEHPDGDHRRIFVPGRPDPVEVEIVSSMPLRHPEWRIVHIVPCLK